MNSHPLLLTHGEVPAIARLPLDKRLLCCNSRFPQTQSRFIDVGPAYTL